MRPRLLTRFVAWVCGADRRLTAASSWPGSPRPAGCGSLAVPGTGRRAGQAGQAAPGGIAAGSSCMLVPRSFRVEQKAIWESGCVLVTRSLCERGPERCVPACRPARAWRRRRRSRWRTSRRPSPRTASSRTHGGPWRSWRATWQSCLAWRPARTQRTTGARPRPMSAALLPGCARCQRGSLNRRRQAEERRQIDIPAAHALAWRLRPPRRPAQHAEAHRARTRALWPLYWLAQGTMFWALFVVGHDWCGAPP